MEYFAVKIPEKYPIKPIEVHVFDSKDKIMPYEQFNALKRMCGDKYDLWETVTVICENEPFIMLVEEEGKFKDFKVNVVATALYANPYDAIVGDVWLCRFDGIENLTYLEEHEVGMIKAALLKRLHIPLKDYDFINHSTEDDITLRELQLNAYNRRKP